MSFKTFCTQYEKQIQFFETLAIILVFILLAFLVYQRYFLEYKVVLVEQDLKGNYHAVKELIVNGQLTDSFITLNLSQDEHNFPKLIIDTQHQVDALKYEQFIYNIS